MIMDIWGVISQPLFVAFFAICFMTTRYIVGRHRIEDERRQSEQYHAESLRLIERAYEIFTQYDSMCEMPKNDRLIWLDTARMIARYQWAVSKITDTTYAGISRSHLIDWRAKFLSVLDQNRSKLTMDYFQPDGKRLGTKSVTRGSIAVIFYFAYADEEMPDILGDINDIRLFAEIYTTINTGFPGLQNYIEQFTDYYADIEECHRGMSEGPNRD